VHTVGCAHGGLCTRCVVCCVVHTVGCVLCCAHGGCVVHTVGAYAGDRGAGHRHCTAAHGAAGGGGAVPGCPPPDNRATSTGTCVCARACVDDGCVGVGSAVALPWSYSIAGRMLACSLRTSGRGWEQWRRPCGACSLVPCVPCCAGACAAGRQQGAHLVLWAPPAVTADSAGRGCRP